MFNIGKIASLEQRIRDLEEELAFEHLEAKVSKNRVDKLRAQVETEVNINCELENTIKNLTKQLDKVETQYKFVRDSIIGLFE